MVNKYKITVVGPAITGMSMAVLLAQHIGVTFRYDGTRIELVGKGQSTVADKDIRIPW